MLKAEVKRRERLQRSYERGAEAARHVVDRLEAFRDDHYPEIRLTFEEQTPPSWVSTKYSVTINGEEERKEWHEAGLWNFDAPLYYVYSKKEAPPYGTPEYDAFRAELQERIRVAKRDLKKRVERLNERLSATKDEVLTLLVRLEEEARQAPQPDR